MAYKFSKQSWLQQQHGRPQNRGESAPPTKVTLKHDFWPPSLGTQVGREQSGTQTAHGYPKLSPAARFGHASQHTCTQRFSVLRRRRRETEPSPRGEEKILKQGWLQQQHGRPQNRGESAAPTKVTLKHDFRPRSLAGGIGAKRGAGRRAGPQGERQRE